MDTSRRTYDAEFKRNAVQLAKESGKPISEIAEELGSEQILCTDGGAS